jgi:hypothetical protein
LLRKEAVFNMGVQIDNRAKDKKFVAYLWDPVNKKRVSAGYHHTREEAEQAVAAKADELGIDLPLAETIDPEAANWIGKTVAPTKPINLKFGVWK